MRREKIIYFVFLTTVIVLACTTASLYLSNNDLNTSSAQEQAKTLATYTFSMETQTRNLVDSFRLYYDYVLQSDQGAQLDENTLIQLESRSFIFLNNEAGSANSVIQIDAVRLSPPDLTKAIKNPYDCVRVYMNVSNTLDYAVKQLDWTTGRLPTEHRQMMNELCHILGAAPTTSNTTLTEISQAFFKIEILCWTNASQNQPSPIIIDTELNWALGNATNLYQNLVTWHNNNPST